ALDSGTPRGHQWSGRDPPDDVSRPHLRPSHCRWSRGGDVPSRNQRGHRRSRPDPDRDLVREANGVPFVMTSLETPLLVVGSHNAKKGAELAELLRPYGLSVATLVDFPDAIEVVEDGDSFAANARLKATQQAKHL